MDSFLGATLQESLYSVQRKRIVHSKEKKDDDEVIESVAGLNILSNNAVNFISAGATAGAVIWWAGAA